MWLGIKRELMIGGIRICPCERLQQQSIMSWKKDKLGTRRSWKRGSFYVPAQVRAQWHEVKRTKWMSYEKHEVRSPRTTLAGLDD